MKSSSESSYEDEDDDDDFQPNAPKRKSPLKRMVTPVKKEAQKKKKVQVLLKPKDSNANKSPLASAYSRKKTASGNISRKGLNNALLSLSKKVLDPEETVEKSLVVALLSAYQVHSPFQKTRRDFISTSTQPTTIYTPRLESLASSIVSKHNEDPNVAQILLLNLLFRSVGGTLRTNLDPQTCILEDMDNEEWGHVVTDLVDEMRHTPADHILFCADPNGAVHAAGVEENNGFTDGVPITHGSLGVREYRKIFEEFWYVLADTALSEGSMSSTSDPDDAISTSTNDGEGSEDDERDLFDRRKRKSIKTSNQKEKKQSNSSHNDTIRYDAELVRDLLVRVTELVSVGQPDVRGAACIAALQMGHAILDKTSLLKSQLETATRQFDAAISSKNKKKQNEKAISLRHRIDRLRRTKADLEEIVLGPVIEGIFIHRYRDSNMYIRASCISALSRMTIQRPDIFMVDKFLKYFGWMLSDKAEVVRIASVSALVAPFECFHGTEKISPRRNIDISTLENVIGKFLTRITDCVIDINLNVQEKAMKLLLLLLKDGFLDDVEDETIWNQINLRALARDTSPSVRRDALYFIIEQLEAFDEDDDDDVENNKTSKAKKRSQQKISEQLIVQRLDAIASWAAHALTDGPVPIDKIQIDLVDYIVMSVRDMPEHKELVTNWAAILKAITDDNIATTSQGTTAGDRADVAKQRVLVEMLACAVKLEVGSVKGSNFMSEDIDPEVLSALEDYEMSLSISKKPKKGQNLSRTFGMQHENLSVALLRELPILLLKFKTDPIILRSLAILPRYLIPTVFSLPQRKNEFMKLAKALAEIYLQSNDNLVLKNTGLSLVHISRGDHARAADAQLQMKKICTSLKDRILNLLSSQNKDEKETANNIKQLRRSSRSPMKSSTDAASTNNSKEYDEEYTLFLNLKRLRALVKRIDVTSFLEDSGCDLEKFVNIIADNLTKRLTNRKIISDDSSDESGPVEQGDLTVWDGENDKVHMCVANSISEGMTFLLSVTAWKLLSVQNSEGLVIQDDDFDQVNNDDNSDDDENEVDHIVLRFRNRIIALVLQCFNLFLSPQSGKESTLSPLQVSFYNTIQEYAGQVSSDLRTLFPKEWSNASSSLLRALSINDDAPLIAGYVHYFRSQEEKLRMAEASEENKESIRDEVKSLFLPLGRSLVTNWKLGNRREAGIALAHVTGSTHEATAFVNSLSRLLKKVDPVRLLEAHMASLRQSYETWMESEPAEIESDRPTDEEMNAFELAEQQHESQFIAIEHQASKFSMSLGVGKLRDPKLTPALQGFVREGLRYSFSNNDPDGEMELVLGSRLSFLCILSKYANWIKKNKKYKETLEEDLIQREFELHNHPEFEEVHEDDLGALSRFRSALGLEVSEILKAEKSANSESSKNSREDHTKMEAQDAATELQSPPSQPSTRNSRGSSLGSYRSRGTSNRSSLSPLYEEEIGDTVDGDIVGNTQSSNSFSDRNRKRQYDSSPEVYGSAKKTQSTYDGEVSDSDIESESEITNKKLRRERSM